ncbi:MAG: efflux RND transporter periplasmic adaptor subunit [Gammaproteobacteria bacterium]|jgi:membrane fusion protein (multidrug efflux system)|nr:efflux RND transporter periplasmic adaptor subunit [Gammaproteobacteria bacterium]
MIISKKHVNISALFIAVKAVSAAVIFLLLIASLLSCGDSDNHSGSNLPARQALHRVEVVIVERQPVSLTQTVSGTLDAVTKIRLYNEESGRITQLPHHEGDFVKQGDLLVQLDNEILKTDVAKARASREQAKLDLDRLKKLLPKNISTEEEVARARTELDLAIAEEQRQLARLKRTSIKAPIDGLITERLYEPGDMLPPQSHILSIIDPSALQLEASLAERWIPLVKQGQTITLRIKALGDRSFGASISRIHPAIDPDTHKGIIEITLNPVPDNARVGQFVQAEIKLKATDRLVIPVHTIHFEPQGAYVFRVVEDDSGNNLAEKVFFKQGQQFNSVTEILSGLNPGDRIVSRGYLGLRDGKKVEIANITNSRNNQAQLDADPGEVNEPATGSQLNSQ